MSVDFSFLYDQEFVANYWRIGGPVPLARLNKTKLANFDLWDEGRQALPTLTTEQNSSLAGSCLVALAASRVDRAGLPPLPAEVAQGLRDIARLPVDAVSPRSPSSLQVLENLLQGPTPHREYLDELFGDRLLVALAHELARVFVVFVPIDPSESDRRVVKFAYDQLLYGHPDEPVSKLEEPVSAPVRAVHAIAEGISWRSRLVQFDALPIGQSQSYHLEVEAPPELEVVSGEVFALDGDGIGYVDEDRDNTRRAHMHLDGLSPEAVAVGQVRMRTAKVGLLAAAWLLAVLTTTFLFFGQQRSESLVAGEATSLLLLLPTLLAAYIARPGEHEITRQLLFGVRAIVVLVGMASVSAVAVIELGLSTGTVQDVLCVLALVVAGLAVVLTISLATTLVKRWQRHAKRDGDAASRSIFLPA